VRFRRLPPARNQNCCAVNYRVSFRGKFVAAPKRAFAQGQLGFHGPLKLLASPKAFSSFLRPLFRQEWVVYCKPPFGG
jgi:hydroxyacyl-ACP dehydratase HTD2-like protein with hotdog domain